MTGGTAFLVLFAMGSGLGTTPGSERSLKDQLEALEPHRATNHLQVDGESFKLPGYLGYWRLDTGMGREVLVLNQQRGAEGLILLLSRDGKILSRLALGAELRSLLLCDMEWDGEPELVLDQLDGWGTGLLQRTLRVIRLDPALREIWRGEGDSFQSPSGQQTALTQAFVRCGRLGRDDETYGESLVVLRQIQLGNETLLETVVVRLVGGETSTVSSKRIHAALPTAGKTR
jgi:hypothetical protein